MKYRIVALLCLFVMLVGCAGFEALSWRDPAHNLELGSREVYEGQDIKKGGRIYKGLYSKMLSYNRKNVQYKFIANRRVPIPADIQLPNLHDRMMIVTGAFKILHSTGPTEICDQSGLWCSSNPSEYSTLGYINPELRVTLKGFDKVNNDKEILNLTTVYRYRDAGPHEYGDLLAIPVISDHGVALNQGEQVGVHIQAKPRVWYSILVEYHDPDNRSGSFIKEWLYTVNK